MPWWALMLLGWAVVAAAAAVWWGKALANADMQDEVPAVADENGPDPSPRTDVRPGADFRSDPVVRHRGCRRTRRGTRRARRASPGAGSRSR